jgi:hypothetical protein
VVDGGVGADEWVGRHDVQDDYRAALEQQMWEKHRQPGGRPEDEGNGLGMPGQGPPRGPMHRVRTGIWLVLGLLSPASRGVLDARACLWTLG